MADTAPTGAGLDQLGRAYCYNSDCAVVPTDVFFMQHYLFHPRQVLAMDQIPLRSRIQPPPARPFRIRRVSMVPHPPARDDDRTEDPATPITPTDGELAWLVAAEATADIDVTERTAIYLHLGCGDNFEAILQMLKTVQRTRVALSSEAMTNLASWLSGYAGSDREEMLRGLIYGESR